MGMTFFNENRSAPADILRQTIGAFASVSDQTDAYGLLTFSGLDARQLLSKLAPIDLHPCVFKVDDVAFTAIAHIGGTLWRLPDQPKGSPVFDLAFPRSMALSFWHGLVACAAGLGLPARS
jgi:sarcosine oxidase subunit gamma